MISVKVFLEQIQSEFASVGISDSKRDAEDLLCQVLDFKRSQLYFPESRNISIFEVERIRELVQRRKEGEPLAYVVGQVEFYHCVIGVGPDVLIPRQETEILVDKIVERLADQDLSGKILVDLCCGSGCIGIALKKRFPQLQVVAIDISAQACERARVNAIKNNVDIEVLEGDLFAPFEGRKAHFLVSNPPYISEDERKLLSPDVKAYEPHLALFAQDSGLSFYRRIEEEARGVLFSGAFLAFECGATQGRELEKIYGRPPWNQGTSELDWAQKDRFFFLEFD